MLGSYSLPLRLLEAHRLSDWPHWTEGNIPGAKTGLENIFCVYMYMWSRIPCQKLLPQLKTPRMPSIFLIWPELKGKACGPDPSVTTRKSWFGQLPAQSRTDSVSSYACMLVGLLASPALVSSSQPGHRSVTQVLVLHVPAKRIIGWWHTASPEAAKAFIFSRMIGEPPAPPDEENEVSRQGQLLGEYVRSNGIFVFLQMSHSQERSQIRWQ